jgi:hypothetical protein
MAESNIRITSNLSSDPLGEDDQLRARIQQVYEAMQRPAYREKEHIICNFTINQIGLYMDNLQGCSLANSKEKMWGLVRRSKGYAVVCKCKESGCAHFNECRPDLKG